MSGFDDFDSTVAEFMQDFGFTATLITVTTGDYDTTTGEAPTTTVNTPVKAILMDYPLRRDGAGTKFGGLVLETDKLCYVQPANKYNRHAVMPVVNPTSDSIKIGSDYYKIVVAKDLNPSASDSIMLELYIRK